MEQLVFDLARPEPPTFGNFVAAGNEEALAALARFARGEAAETVLVLWGAPGGGKSHLLQAAVAAARTAGRPARFLAEAEAVGPEAPQPGELVAVDRIDAAEAGAQARCFTLFNALAAGRGQLVAASSLPPARTGLRDDLRTRLGWGLVYEIRPLADADKPAALAAHAAQRGLALGADVIAYLLAHGRRDMASLTAALAELDRRSLALKRPITLPLVREWIQRDIGLGRP